MHLQVSDQDLNSLYYITTLIKPEDDENKGNDQQCKMFALPSPLDQVFDIGLLYLFKIFDNFDVFRTVQKQSESKVVVFCQRK